MSSVAASAIVRRPVSMPMGRAPARHIFRPLSPGGLWLAVTMTPGKSRTPDAQ